MQVSLGDDDWGPLWPTMPAEINVDAPGRHLRAALAAVLVRDDAPSCESSRKAAVAALRSSLTVLVVNLKTAKEARPYDSAIVALEGGSRDRGKPP
jgi:hypothetical protein